MKRPFEVIFGDPSVKEKYIFNTPTSSRGVCFDESNFP